MPKKTPRQAYRIHARNRFFVRFGIRLKSGDLGELEGQIRDRKAQMVEDQIRGRRVYVVKYEGAEYYAVFDRRTDCIVTFLTPEQFADKEYRA